MQRLPGRLAGPRTGQYTRSPSRAPSACARHQTFPALELGRIGRRHHMVRFVLSRIGQTLAVLFTVSVIIFALMRMIPGDPVLMRLGDDFTQEAYDRLRGELGLDRSIVTQYVIWL